MGLEDEMVVISGLVAKLFYWYCSTHTVLIPVARSSTVQYPGVIVVREAFEANSDNCDSTVNTTTHTTRQ